jgi:hypothetical protein
MKIEEVKKIELDGLEVVLFRGVDGVLVVELSSGGLESKDEHQDGVPNIRLWINEQKIEVAPNGNLLVEGVDVEA